MEQRRRKDKRYTATEIVGKHFSIFYFKDDLERGLPQKLLDQAAHEGRVRHEGWRKRKDGSRFWASLTITAIHDDNNSVIGFCKVTMDLSDKKEVENSLRMSEERYHQMISEVQDYAIILLNAEGIIENWNTGAEKIKGYTANEVIGKRFDLFYTKDDRDDQLPDKLLNQAREQGKAVHEGWRVRKDGTKFWGTIVITALHGKKGDVIGFTKVTRDLTLQKLADDKVRAYTSELEVQNRELEQFAYVASHDLQEPLRKIQTFAELILDNYEDREFVNTYFKKLDASAKRMSELIKSLLDYSRLSKDNLQNTEVDLNVIMADIKQDFELLIEEKKATIVYDLLPVLHGNHIQLGQLFSNVISNSLKFSETSPVIKINAVTVYKDHISDISDILINKKYCMLIFEDNGIGFEQKYDKIIFSLFQRLHGKQAYAGTGIGLALCKKIVENHDGFIEAYSELGKGAKFHVYLPLEN